MPTVDLHLDQQLIASVASAGYSMINLHIYGSPKQEQFATADLFAAHFPEEGKARTHFFIGQQLVSAGQPVCISFTEHGACSHAGKTLEELYPDEPAVPEDYDFSLSQAEMEAYQAQPDLRSPYRLTVSSPSGETLSISTASTDGFTLSAQWLQDWHPESLKISLRGYRRVGNEADSERVDYFQTRLKTGESLHLVIDSVDESVVAT